MLPNATERVNDLLDEFDRYVNEARFNAVASKIGTIDFDDKSWIGKLMSPMISDTFEDFFKENEGANDAFDPGEKKAFQSGATQAVREFILRQF